MATVVGERRLITGHETAVTSRTGPVAWLLVGAALFFAVPFVGADTFGLQPDLYYLGYFTIALVWFVGFAVRYAEPLRPMWREHRWASIAVGAGVGAVVAAMLLNQPGTDRPEGWRFGFELVWRGLVYGSIDALTLYVFPASVAYLLMRGNRRGVWRKVGFAALALMFSLLVTATYHLGYTEYRGEDMRYPEIGALVANVPTAVTGNPIGAVATHATMHVTAVVHQRNGGEARMLPPKVTEDYPNHGSSDLAAGLAAGWLLAAAGALTLALRRKGAEPSPEKR